MCLIIFIFSPSPYLFLGEVYARFKCNLLPTLFCHDPQIYLHSRQQTQHPPPLLSLVSQFPSLPSLFFTVAYSFCTFLPSSYIYLYRYLLDVSNSNTSTSSGNRRNYKRWQRPRTSNRTRRPEGRHCG